MQRGFEDRGCIPASLRCGLDVSERYLAIRGGYYLYHDPSIDQGTHYVVNSFASSLRSGRSSIVTVFVSSLQNPHFAASMQGIVDAFENSNFHLMFAQTGYSEALEIDVVNSVMT